MRRGEAGRELEWGVGPWVFGIIGGQGQMEDFLGQSFGTTGELEGCIGGPRIMSLDIERSVVGENSRVVYLPGAWGVLEYEAIRRRSCSLNSAIAVGLHTS